MENNRLYSLPIFNRPPLMDVPGWAKSHRYMQNTASMFSYEQTPYLELPSHYLSDLAETSMVVIKTPCQVGKTETIMNFLGWMYTYYASNTMLILDSLKSGQKMAHNRIRPYMRDCLGINNPKNTRNKNPDKSNSLINIGLGSGASLFICSAKSVSDLRSTPSRFILMDECDAWKETIEGDPVELALKRAMRFRSMACMTSTPTTPDNYITKYFMLGTQQTWGCKCSTCGSFMNVLYKDIDFTGSTPTFACKKCGQVYSEEDIKALEHCYSDPQNTDPYKDELGRIRRSFEIMAPLCHAFYSWDGLKRSELASLALGEATYQSFVNTTLGEAYVPKEECEVQLTDLMRLSQGHYDHNSLPTDIAFIVVGADTHDTCLYVNTMGFSADLKRLYGIRYDILVGDPNEKEVWDSFYSLFNTVYIRRDGVELMPGFAFCDSGGHRTNAVYMQEFKSKRFLPIKGYVSNKANVADPLLGKLQKFNLNAGIKGKALVQMLGVNAGKDALNNFEVLTVAGEQHLFFPKGYGYDAEFFKGLLAEKRIDGKWIAPRGSKTANEPTDTTVYAYACAHYYYQKYWATGKDREALESLKVVQESVKMAENEKIKPEIKSNEPKKTRGRKKKADEVENVSIEKNADTNSHPVDNPSTSEHLILEKPPVKKFRHL